MWKKILQLFMGYICGYLFIAWFPVGFPFQLSEFLLEFVLNPFEFFAVSVVFIFGFLINADILRNGFEQSMVFAYQRKGQVFDIILSIGLLVVFFILFVIGFWHTVIFFCFSVLYGIISLDFNRLRILQQ